MQPGTLEHDDPADFTARRYYFVLHDAALLYGQADQNFNVMLKAQHRKLLMI
ncbi:hypothetical protein O9992_04130 [Vibrio lentus]|nr:hypothetical protein [Vibrio lentus]